MRPEDMRAEAKDVVVTSAWGDALEDLKKELFSSGILLGMSRWESSPVPMRMKQL